MQLGRYESEVARPMRVPLHSQVVTREDEYRNVYIRKSSNKERE